MAKSTVWLGALESPSCTAFPHLSGVGWAPDRLWPPHYPPKNPNFLPKSYKIRIIPAVYFLLGCIFWTHHSSVLVLPVLFKGNIRKESTAKNQQQESSHILVTLLTGDSFFNTLIKSYHLIKFSIFIITVNMTYIKPSLLSVI